MRLAVLCSPESWYFADLQRAAAGRHELLNLSFSDLGSSCRDGGLQVTAAGHVLNELDAVLVRTMPPGSLEQVVFRMDALARLRAAGVAVVNPPRAIEAAVDKYLATALLAAAGLPTPRTVVCQTAEEALAAFEQLGRDVVVKPLFGGEGRGIFRIADPDLAHRAFHTLQQLKAVAYIQEFVPHAGYDVRLFVLGEEVFGMRRVQSAGLADQRQPRRPHRTLPGRLGLDGTGPDCHSCRRSTHGRSRYSARLRWAAARNRGERRAGLEGARSYTESGHRRVGSRLSPNGRAQNGGAQMTTIPIVNVGLRLSTTAHAIRTESRLLSRSGGMGGANADIVN